jgi:hypothetical protein
MRLLRMNPPGLQRVSMVYSSPFEQGARQRSRSLNSTGSRFLLSLHMIILLRGSIISPAEQRQEIKYETRAFSSWRYRFSMCLCLTRKILPLQGPCLQLEFETVVQPLKDNDNRCRLKCATLM